jgi:hypothetical protein
VWDTAPRHRSDPAPAVETKHFFAWEPPEERISIQLRLDVMERMERDVIEAFKALPKRGAEVGGLLLGRAEQGDPRRVFINDFVPVACEYRRGPSYFLSETDLAELERTLSRCQSRVVGFYRSHTRPNLSLDEEDRQRIHTYFSGPSNVFLLIKPLSITNCVAGFFFWREGVVHGEASHLEFRFGGRSLPAAGSVRSAATQAGPDGPRQPMGTKPSTASDRTRVRWSLAAVGLLGMLSTLLGFHTWDTIRASRPVPVVPVQVVIPEKPTPMPIPQSAPVAEPVRQPPPPATPTVKTARPSNRIASRNRKAVTKAKSRRAKSRLSRLWPFHRSQRQ